MSTFTFQRDADSDTFELLLKSVRVSSAGEIRAGSFDLGEQLASASMPAAVDVRDCLPIAAHMIRRHPGELMTACNPPHSYEDK